jgi:hypothetical protein
MRWQHEFAALIKKIWPEPRAWMREFGLPGLERAERVVI